MDISHLAFGNSKCMSNSIYTRLAGSDGSVAVDGVLPPLTGYRDTRGWVDGYTATCAAPAARDWPAATLLIVSFGRIGGETCTYVERTIDRAARSIWRVVFMDPRGHKPEPHTSR
jgi:predicted alpha/beta-fold hydrolase